MFPSPAFRQMLIIGIGTAVAQQAVGIDAIQYFLIYILDESGISGELAKTGILIGLGAIKLVFILLAGRLFDRRGRRPLMLFSCAGKRFRKTVADSTSGSLHFLSKHPSQFLPPLQECASPFSAYH
jgi:MFS family permease